MALTAALRYSAAVLAASLVVAGCGSAPKKSGGYYLDDGPGGTPPVDLARVPDATPRAEPIRQATTRPYTVNGRTYRPFAMHRSYKARGMASWYGKRYHGQQTASGETYDMYSMTAAHTVLPLPSYARVTNLANGRSVIVRVNDRGPFLSERIIDVSYAAAYKLGFIDDGSTMVEVEAILPEEIMVTSAPITAATEPPPRAGSLKPGRAASFCSSERFPKGTMPRHTCGNCVPTPPGWATRSTFTGARISTGFTPDLMKAARQPISRPAAYIVCSVFRP